MVTSLESRKLRIIDSLVEVSSERTILLIEALLQSESDFWNQLTDKQKARIQQAINELDAGLSIPHETVMQDLRKKYQA